MPALPRPRQPAAEPAAPPALTAAEAVALSLLRDGYAARTIHTRTGTGPEALYRLAAAWGVTAPCGTVEGHDCHTARGEDPCWGCDTAHGRTQARALAAQRRRIIPSPTTRTPRQGRKAARR